MKLVILESGGGGGSNKNECGEEKKEMCSREKRVMLFLESGVLQNREPSFYCHQFDFLFSPFLSPSLFFSHGRAALV